MSTGWMSTVAEVGDSRMTRIEVLSIYTIHARSDGCAEWVDRVDAVGRVGDGGKRRERVSVVGEKLVVGWVASR